MADNSNTAIESNSSSSHHHSRDDDDARDEPPTKRKRRGGEPLDAERQASINLNRAKERRQWLEKHGFDPDDPTKMAFKTFDTEEDDEKHEATPMIWACYLGDLEMCHNLFEHEAAGIPSSTSPPPAGTVACEGVASAPVITSPFTPSLL